MLMFIMYTHTKVFIAQLMNLSQLLQLCKIKKKDMKLQISKCDQGIFSILLFCCWSYIYYNNGRDIFKSISLTSDVLLVSFLGLQCSQLCIMYRDKYDPQKGFSKLLRSSPGLQVLLLQFFKRNSYNDYINHHLEQTH